ncbi:MAG: SDR family NAD(P)-dependent oxidoreductase [Anaerolineae bacterium]|nr:SDR family NAD(P)-dependent oxidoreductase [Anaerolineae bacterium]
MSKLTLVTGGAGFIGCNYAARLLERGEKVVIYDNLSRHGAVKNLEWLHQRFGRDSFQLIQGDVREADRIRMAAENADAIVHLAAQVAVTTSVTNPREDFEINALGTFNVLEAARASGRNPVILYASTNKVYGGMEELRVLEDDRRYHYADLPLGVSETQPLDFHSPYGCSKGAGDQYCRDYYRIYGIPTVVFRQSCIYGERQFGIEDQGWVAWFVIAALTNRQITIYGDGKQVRDILYIEDLLDAYDAAFEHVDTAAGQIFNIGGGPQNVMSIWIDFGPLLEKLLGKSIIVKRGDWRPGDQRIYVSDIRKAEQALGWTPRTPVETGIRRLFEWAKTNQFLF